MELPAGDWSGTFEADNSSVKIPITLTSEPEQRTDVTLQFTVNLPAHQQIWYGPMQGTFTGTCTDDGTLTLSWTGDGSTVTATVMGNLTAGPNGRYTIEGRVTIKQPESNSEPAQQQIGTVQAVHAAAYPAEKHRHPKRPQHPIGNIWD